jgi:thiamine-phosphate pyrophosphorylase
MEQRAGRLGRLHVITDASLQTRLTHAEVARRALAGGADTVQFREKRPLVTRELVSLAREVVAVCREAGATCIVNDRADVAFAVAADGLHLGRDDLAPEVARAIIGPGRLIGGTANSIEEARQVMATSVDYIGVGPVYGTASKANPAPVLGVERLRAIAQASPVPVIAIGNITPDSVAEVLDTGAYGVAVLSRITCDPDPEAAARRYADAIAAWLQRGSSG